MRAIIKSSFADLMCIFMSIAIFLPVHAENLGAFDTQLKSSKYINKIVVSIGAREYDVVRKEPQFNCTYSSGAEKKIKQLLNALESFHLKRIPEAQAHIPVVEIEIHFILQNGKEDILYLGRRYLGEDGIDGELVVARHKRSNFVTVSNALSEWFLSWIQDIDEVSFSQSYGGSMNDLLKECRDKASGKYYIDRLGPNAATCARRSLLVSHETEMCYLK